LAAGVIFGSPASHGAQGRDPVSEIEFSCT
jgi:hypothetical protein